MLLITNKLGESTYRKCISNLGSKIAFQDQHKGFPNSMTNFQPFQKKTSSSPNHEMFFLSSLIRIRVPDSDRIQFEVWNRIFSITEPYFFLSRIRIKEFEYFKPKKLFLSSRKYDTGCSSRIRILIFYNPRIPDPGVKKAPDHGSRIRNTASLSPKNCHQK
jgi:hypothetical protein